MAFITLAERKILRLTGFRQGPNKVSILGLLQPIADAVKLSNKSSNQLSNFFLLIYYLSTIFIIIISLMLWSCQPFGSLVISWKFSFVVMILVLGVMAIKRILSGWRTYSKYSLLGSIRTVSQMISYESVLYLCLLCFIWFNKRFRIFDVYTQEYFILIIFIPFVLFFWVPAILAELRRTPYDFSEGESELVSGFNTEFGSKSFTLIFLSEYRNIIFFILLTSILLFSQKNNLFFFIVLSFFNFWIIWLRRTLPRIRFDKFMDKAWKFFIPFITSILIIFIFKI